jgi:prenylcysteine alpha-carboxyl methylesterase
MILIRRLVNNVLLIFTLLCKLLTFVRLNWLFKFARLLVFSALLLPAFIRIGWFYATDRRIRRGVRYGSKARNFLDIYVPSDDCSSSSRSSSRGAALGRKEEGEEDVEEGGEKSKANAPLKPVVIFVTGGVWIIGYRVWGALLAKSLLEFGVITICIDYRNFPQGVMGDMVEDVSAGIGYAVRKAKSLGGDPRKINLVGQSAGAHLAALALLKQASLKDDVQQKWHAKDIIGFVGISGIYHPESDELINHFDKQGLHRKIFFSIMEAGFSGRHIEALGRNSPSEILKMIGVECAHVLPRFLLIHGEKDISAPTRESQNFAPTLSKAGISVMEKYYKSKGHVEPFILDPILGRSEDILLEDLLTFIFRREGLSKTFKRQPLMRPRFIVELAKWVVPF